MDLLQYSVLLRLLVWLEFVDYRGSETYFTRERVNFMIPGSLRACVRLFCMWKREKAVFYRQRVNRLAGLELILFTPVASRSLKKIIFAIRLSWRLEYKYDRPPTLFLNQLLLTFLPELKFLTHTSTSLCQRRQDTQNPFPQTSKNYHGDHGLLRHVLCGPRA